MSAPTNGASLVPTAAQLHLPVSQLYKKLEMVGKGAYGSVHKGIHIPSGTVVALKIINLDTEDDDVQDIQREVALLSQLRGGEGSNVTRYYGSWLDGPRVWIVMDYASGGSVRTLMKATKNNVIEERFVVLIVREVLTALSFLHKSRVIHRDIKAANVLLTSAGRILLCDFGVSALLSTTHSKRTTFVGTPYWMAPEVISSGSLYDTKADIWSLGITIYEMITGSPPHADQEAMRALVLIPKSKPPKLPENDGSRDMKDFMATCLKELPADRPTAEVLSRAKWIKATSRTPVSYLRELISRYEAWKDKGGVRESLAGNLPWEEDDSNMVTEADWEFDTLRHRPDFDAQDSQSIADSSFDSTISDSSVASMSSSINSSSASANTSIASTAQPPRSLRMLFEDSSTPNLFPPPVLRLPLPHSPTQPPASPASNYPNTPQSDGGLTPRNDATDLLTARQNDFAFPSTSHGHSLSSSDGPSKISYRDVRTSKGLADITIPPSDPSSSERTRTTSTSSTNVLSPSQTPERPSSRLTPPSSDDDEYTRGAPNVSPTIRSSPRSPQKDVSRSPRSHRIRLSPVKFTFPAPSGGVLSDSPAGTDGEGSHSPSPSPSPALSRKHSHSRSHSHLHQHQHSHSHSSTSSLSSSNHKTSPRRPNLSVDINSHPSPSNEFPPPMPSQSRRQLTLPATIFHPPLGRAHSASPYDPQNTARTTIPSNASSSSLTRPILHRQASVPMLDSPSSWQDRPSTSRNETETQFPGELGVPRLNVGGGGLGVGLKDVLKLTPVTSGDADLLPPSPGVAIAPSPITRYYPSSPSQAPGNASFSTNGLSADSHLANSRASPARIHALDYTHLLSSPDELYKELSRTVDELGSWLMTVEIGLTRTLAPVPGPGSPSIRSTPSFVSTLSFNASSSGLSNSSQNSTLPHWDGYGEWEAADPDDDASSPRRDENGGGGSDDEDDGGGDGGGMPEEFELVLPPENQNGLYART